MNKDLIYIGEITGVFGIKGELKVYTESDFIDSRFKPGQTIYLKQHNNQQNYKISSMRIHKNNVLITLNQMYDINLVTSFVGAKLYALNNDDLDLESDEYVLDDLVGLKVIDEELNDIGEVVDFIEVPQGAIMEVIKNGKKTLFPFVDEFILEITDEYIKVKVLEICQ